MLPLHLLDEDTVEALLTGRPVQPGLAPLAGAVGQIRAASRQPVRPSDELARRMASGDFTGITPALPASEPARRRLRSWLAGASPRARVVTGAVVVFTGLSAATAAGALPGGAQARVESFIETVTPISFQRDEPAPDLVEDVSDTRTTEPGTSRPDDPGKPVTPPGKPETPPGKPEKPPGKPETPPGKPPEKPDNPNKPESPPGKPEKTEKPGNQGNGNGNSGNGNGNSGNSGNGNSGNGNGNGNGNGP
ncbi:hypothetical protein [Jiangella endophytica]|uniref:hypothetical protein n=1 Tax=Jiangella endophytica TaxID=1623398 RepID=UPI000E34DAAB|nr:hypothetical protein [Jiangella endophytica]